MTATVFRPVKGKVRVRIPYRLGNRAFLKGSGITRGIEWDGSRGLWLVPRSRLQDLLDHLTTVYDVDVYIDGSAQQKCDIRCAQATGIECECSCAGANHGGLNAWMQVTDTLLVNTTTTRTHFRIEAAA
jgi:hypothetical protein